MTTTNRSAKPARLPYIDPCEVCGGSHLTWLHRGSQGNLCPTKALDPHLLGEFPMTCYRCHVEADS